MIPLRVARNIVPCDKNLIDEYSSDGPIRECPIAQAHGIACFEGIRLCLRFILQRWSVVALQRSSFRRNKILMVPLGIARNIVPCNKNLVAQYATNGPVRGFPIAQAYGLAYFERVRFCVRLILRNSVTLDLGRVWSACHFSIPRGSKHYTLGNLQAKRLPHRRRLEETMSNE